MPKRPNPFGENSPLQQKTHIGKKEVDMGVNMENNMQKVYDRTKNLLFQGSRQVVDCSSCNHDDQDWGSDHDRDDVLRPLPGQMRLDPEGRLCAQISTNGDGGNHGNSDKDRDNQGDMETDSSAPIQKPVLEAETSSKPGTPVKQLQLDMSGRLSQTSAGDIVQPTPAAGFCICPSCNRPTHISTRRCAFCDKPTCTNCLSQCFSCQGLHCPVCCIINYDDCVEKAYCLQCPVKMS